MRSSRIFHIVAASLLVACGSPRPNEAGSPSTIDPSMEQSARAFVATVARDITREGPIAWHRYFDDGPAFFMAVNGRLVFADGKAAHATIPAIARAITHIELTWGSNVRVDPLSPDVVLIGAPYHEMRIGSGGERLEEDGFFTGVAERHDGRWRFRNAHWSVPASSASSGP
jgi:hypothetical protein